MIDAVARRPQGASDVFTTKEQADGHRHDEGRHGNFLQGLEHGRADLFSSRMATVSGRLGRPDDVFLSKGYRVIAHDRRGHGRSTQTAAGHDMDTYADDAFEVVKKLDLKETVHIGHSTGGGEVRRYVARHGKGNVKKAVLISAIPPLFKPVKRHRDVGTGGLGRRRECHQRLPLERRRDSFPSSSIGPATKYPKASGTIGGDKG
jgi:pimeloyl-ACP methyl ester carboxylesterase